MSTIPNDNKDGDKNVYDPEAQDDVRVVDVGADDVDVIDQAYLSASRSTRIFRSTLFQMFMFGAYVGFSQIQDLSLTLRQHSICGPSNVGRVSPRVSHMFLYCWINANVIRIQNLVRPFRCRHAQRLNILVGWRWPVNPLSGQPGDFTELRGLYVDHDVRRADHQQDRNQVGLYLGCFDHAIGWVWLLRQCQIRSRCLLARRQGEFCCIFVRTAGMVLKVLVYRWCWQWTPVCR